MHVRPVCPETSVVPGIARGRRSVIFSLAVGVIGMHFHSFWSRPTCPFTFAAVSTFIYSFVRSPMHFLNPDLIIHSFRGSLVVQQRPSAPGRTLCRSTCTIYSGCCAPRALLLTPIFFVFQTTVRVFAGVTCLSKFGRVSKCGVSRRERTRSISAPKEIAHNLGSCRVKSCLWPLLPPPILTRKLSAKKIERPATHARGRNRQEHSRVINEAGERGTEGDTHRPIRCMCSTQHRCNMSRRWHPGRAAAECLQRRRAP